MHTHKQINQWNNTKMGKNTTFHINVIGKPGYSAKYPEHVFSIIGLSLCRHGFDHKLRQITNCDRSVAICDCRNFWPFKTQLLRLICHMVCHMISHVMWCDMVYDIIWCMIYHMISYDMMLYHMISYDIIWYDAISYDIIWYYMIWHIILNHIIPYHHICLVRGVYVYSFLS